MRGGRAARGLEQFTLAPTAYSNGMRTIPVASLG